MSVQNLIFSQNLLFFKWIDIRVELKDGTLNARDIQKSLRLYRCLQLLLKECNVVYDVLLGSTFVLNALFAVLCTFGSIRFHGLVAVGFAWIGTSCTVLLAMLLGVMADFNGKSKLLLVMFRWNALNCRRGPIICEFGILKRQLRAVTELKFQVGALYFVDKQNVMTVFKIIFDYTINLLILH